MICHRPASLLVVVFFSGNGLGHVFDLYHAMLQINSLWGYLHFGCGHKWMPRSAATPVGMLLRLSLLARGGCIYGPGGYGAAVIKSESTPMHVLSDPAGRGVR